MKKSAYGKPILISNGESSSIKRLENVDELTIQNLIFDFPECLPISDIDESYNPVISVCKELRTPTGPLDILMITPNGDIIIIETKLWRNPEARRKVIAQILDYANELSKWTYEDLQREVNRNLGVKGNFLYEISKSVDDNLILQESDFVDAITRNLAKGKFLLLIVGDGIREGAAGIANFLTNAAHLNFALGMVELTVYEINGKNKIVLPRTIVKTTEIQKISIDLPEGLVISNSTQNTVIVGKQKENISPEIKKRRKLYRAFWKDFIADLELDDQGQQAPVPTMTQNIYLYPGKNKYAWISAYFMPSKKRIGVYFRCQNDQRGLELAENLLEYKEEIKEELGAEILWLWDENPRNGFGVRLHLEDVHARENQEDIKMFFTLWLNRFVNALRPRMKEFQ